MRFSPVLLAIFTVFLPGLASTARAQGLDIAENVESFGISEDFQLGQGLWLAQSTPTAQPDSTQPPGDNMPDRIELDLTPQADPPQLDIELPESQPQPEVAPAPDPAPTLEPFESAPEDAEPEPSPVLTPGTLELDPLEPESTDPTVAPGQEPEEPETEAAPATEAEPRVLVSEVVVEGAEGDLQDEVYRVINTRPGRTTTRSQLQEDINAVFATGFFSNVRVTPEDTPLGVRVTFTVQPNPVLSQVVIRNSLLETIRVEQPPDEPLEQPTFVEVPLQEAVDDIFQEQYGEILNFRDLQAGIQQVNQLYQENGYVLAQVIESPQVTSEGVVFLDVAEGLIEDIQVRFLDEEGNAVDAEGNPIEGKTREFIITREFESQPGDVFNQQQIQRDLQRAFALGIFEDLRISLNPGQDPRQVDVIVNVIERNTGSLAAGVGFSSASGIFGSASFQEQNLGGNNHRLGAEVQIGERQLLFDVSFTDPWIATDPYRTSYTVNAFARQNISLIFDGGDTIVELPNEERPRVRRIGGGVTFSRPLDEWLGLDDWRASLGLQYQNISIRDVDGTLSPIDEFGNDLSFSGTGTDDLLTVQLSALQDRRNNPLVPTSGSVLRLSTEQSVPVGSGSILLNRLRGSYSFYIPVRITDFTAGCRLDNPTPNDCPQTLAFNVQAGTVLGDLPPYEAFSLGGTDSVRGYDSGEVGSGRSFVLATAEYRFPIFSIINGALFVDFGSDLGTADDVPGSPAEIRDKPGTGFGYGVGIRLQSPIGQIRVDYGFNDQGDNRIHFGIGERF